MKSNFLTSINWRRAASGQSSVTRDWSLILVVAILLGFTAVGWRSVHFWFWEQYLSQTNSLTVSHQLDEARLNQAVAKLKIRANQFTTILNSPALVKDPSR